MTYRHLILIDFGTQWFCKLARYDADVPKDSAGRIDAKLTDVPSLKYPFLDNIYERESIPGLIKFTHDSNQWCGWSISEAEYKRILRLIELLPNHEEFKRLTQYP